MTAGSVRYSVSFGVVLKVCFALFGFEPWLGRRSEKQCSNTNHSVLLGTASTMYSLLHFYMIGATPLVLIACTATVNCKKVQV